jgi:D-alanyl-lipoteichoic acid acyltransferase DltB (MBOAT superfamily)
MLFPTIDFAIFFAVAFTVNWLLNPYSGWWKLSMIGLSYVFYGWVGWSYCLLLLLTTVVSFAGGTWVTATRSERSRRIAMGVSVGALLAILGWFKYFGFVSVNLDNLTHAMGLGRAVPLLQVGLPIAISFFTFMAISYVVDVYRRDLEPAKALDFAVYISFFPHLLAGPIVRGGELLPQIRRRRDEKSVDYSRAFWLILAGLFKKVVISSYVSSAIVTPVFTSPSQHSAPEAIFAAWGYAVQIYCDFSGYTDIAIGLAMLLGFRFPQNFDAPYTARNLQDFWRRWHMTLSRWLRDYLYIPLGGSANGQAQTVRNIMITMVLGGLWHGAAWTFVAWGALMGLGQSFGHLRRTRRERRGLPGVAEGPVRVWVQRFLTFQYVCLGWVFFNATGMSQAFALIGRAFRGWGEASPLVTPLLVVTVLGTIALQFVPKLRVDRLQATFSRQKAAVQAGLLGVALLGITTFGPVGVAPFIYYRF